MMFARLKEPARRRARRARGVFRQDLHDVAHLRRVLERERARSDRTGDPFSFLIFTPRGKEFELATWRRLAKILKRRLRLTDDAGWLDGERIGVVLPHTPASGAWKLADDVCLEFPPRTPPPLCEVYTYPTDWVDDERNDETGDDTRRRDDAARQVDSLGVFFERPMPAWKRWLDVVGSGVGLIALAPLFLLVAIAIKIGSPGPVLFRQDRSGLGGRRFKMYKFRSMVAGAERRQSELRALNEQDGPAFKLTADPRVTRLGRFLRATSIDELPQLWNVLLGEMSLVGPRPLPCAESDACESWQQRRMDVTPGLTCIWQVRGRSRVSFAEWVRMDLEYARSVSPATDIKILFQTVPAVLLRKGAK
ncbi:MAG TPA: sugar transferase [Pirellulales bacterium]|nr:sugar transferase [Pirellulales bacterium]